MRSSIYRTWVRPAKATRLMVVLHCLKYTFNESDESVVARWAENAEVGIEMQKGRARAVRPNASGKGLVVKC